MSVNVYENDNYIVSITREPAGLYDCYGVVNKRYGVTEAYLSQLAKALAIADMFDKDLKDPSRLQAPEPMDLGELLQSMKGRSSH